MICHVMLCHVSYIMLCHVMSCYVVLHYDTIRYDTIRYLYLIVPFWYASAAYQASLVEPWFVFGRDAVEPKYPW